MESKELLGALVPVTNGELEARKQACVNHLGAVTGLVVEWGGESDMAIAKAVTDMITEDSQPEIILVALETAEYKVTDPEAASSIYLGVANALIESIPQQNVEDIDDDVLKDSNERFDAAFKILKEAPNLNAEKAASTLRSLTRKLGVFTPAKEKFIFISKEESYLQIYEEASRLELDFIERCPPEINSGAYELAKIIAESKWSGSFPDIRNRACRYAMDCLIINASSSAKDVLIIGEQTSRPDIVCDGLSFLVESSKTIKTQIQELQEEYEEHLKIREEAQDAYDNLPKWAVRKKTFEKAEAAEKALKEAQTQVTKTHDKRAELIRIRNNIREDVTNFTVSNVVTLMNDTGQIGLSGRELVELVILDNTNDNQLDEANLVARMNRLAWAFKDSFKETYKEFAEGEIVDGVNPDTLRAAHDFIEGRFQISLES